MTRHVGPRWGAGTECFATASEWRVYENTRALIEAGTDPSAVLIEHGHRAGLESMTPHPDELAVVADAEIMRHLGNRMPRCALLEHSEHAR